MPNPFLSDAEGYDAERSFIPTELPPDIIKNMAEPKKNTSARPDPQPKEAVVTAEPERVLVLFPNGVSGHLQPRGYAIYTREKHGNDFVAKADDMLRRFQGIRVYEVPTVDGGEKSAKDSVVL